MINSSQKKTKKIIAAAFGEQPSIDLRGKIMTKIATGQLQMAPRYNLMITRRALQFALASTILINLAALYFFIQELLNAQTIVYLKQALLGLSDYRSLVWPAVGQAMPWLAIILLAAATSALVFVSLFKRNFSRNLLIG